MSEHQHTYRTLPASDAFRDGWERIFGKKAEPKETHLIVDLNKYPYTEVGYSSERGFYSEEQKTAAEGVLDRGWGK